MLADRFRIVLVLAAAMIVASPGMSVAQTDEFVAHAAGDGFLVSIPEVVDVGGGNTEADLTSDPTAHAFGAGFLLAEDSISEVTIDRDGVAQRDPDEGQNCAGPDLPDPLAFAAETDFACSFAEGDTTGAHSSAEAAATGAEIAVTGEGITELVAFLLTSIDEGGLGDAVDEVEDQVLDPIREALADACLEIVGSPLGDVFSEASDLIEEIEDSGELPLNFPVTEGEPCELLLRYVTDPPVITDDPLAFLQATLEAALADVSLLEATLAASDSSTTETADAVTAAATALGVDVSLLSLNVLGNLVDALETLVQDFLTQVSDDLGDLADPLPSVTELLPTILDAIPQELQDVLDSDQPLLTVTGGQAAADATYDRGSEAVTTDGTVAPLVFDLNDDLVALLQLDDIDPIVVPEGDSQTIAEGTPLESTATLAACTTTEGESDGLPGEEIHCAGLDLVLLKGVIGDDPETDELDGGIRLAGAAVTAAVYGEAVAAAAPPADEEPLPDTGGGAALFGLLALATAVGLTRWRRTPSER